MGWWEQPGLDLGDYGKETDMEVDTEMDTEMEMEGKRERGDHADRAAEERWGTAK